MIITRTINGKEVNIRMNKYGIIVVIDHIEILRKEERSFPELRQLFIEYQELYMGRVIVLPEDYEYSKDSL